MIAITRSLVRRLRAVFRRTGIRRGSSPAAWIRLVADGKVLRIRLATPEVAVEFRLAGDFPAEQINLPYEFLADCEGTKDDTVLIEAQLDGRSLVRWPDRGVPQMAVYDGIPPGDVAEFPADADNYVPNEPVIWQALHDACQTADRDRSRYALDSLQLRGDRGQIAATDGRQVLLQQGFQFPWQQDLIVPASPVLGCREITCHEAVAIGSTKDWVVIKTEAWSVFLRIDREARYPKFDDLFRSVQRASSTLAWSTEDRRFLFDALPRLPGSDDRFQPVTIDLNGEVVVRAADEPTAATTELLLGESKLQGEPVRLNTNRRYLQRAVELGFSAVHFFGAKAPAQCCDERRQYLWALLGDETAVPPSENAVRIDSRVAAAAATITLSDPLKPRSTMSQSNKKSTAKPSAHSPAPEVAQSLVAATEPTGDQHQSTPANPIAQAEALRTSLRDALAKTSQLIVSLKRQRRQSKLVQSTLAALQELRTAG